MSNLTDELTKTDSELTDQNEEINLSTKITLDQHSSRVSVIDLDQPGKKIKKKEEATPEEPHRQTKAKETKRFLRLASDRTGQSLIMLGLLGLVLSTQFRSPLWLIPAGSALLLIRAIGRALFTRQNYLNHRDVRTTLAQTFKEESLIGLAFLATCFLFGWPPNVFDATLFLAANLVAQGAVTVILRELVINDTDGRIDWPTQKLQSLIIVGTGEAALKLADSVIDHSELATRIEGFVDFNRTGLWRYRDIPLIGHPDQLDTIVGEKQVDLLAVALDDDQISLSHELFQSAETMGVPIGLVCDWHKRTVARPQGSCIGDLPLVVFHSAPNQPVMLTIKTAFDRVMAAVGLIFISPVMLLTGLLIKTESKGPIFFKQIRSGLNGQPFEIYKFRTMGNDAEAIKESLADQNEMSGPVFKIKSDPRITRIGHYLRKYSIDELPQLINVVRGEMSLVGPRPPLPKEVAGMEPWQRRKLSVKPGVTCTWQVSGRNAIDFEEWMRLDLEYIDNWSLWGDIKLIARTVPTVIKGSGT